MNDIVNGTKITLIEARMIFGEDKDNCPQMFYCRFRITLPSGQSPDQALEVIFNWDSGEIPLEVLELKSNILSLLGASSDVTGVLVTAGTPIPK